MVDLLLRHREIAFWLTAFSITTFLASALLVPVLCLRMDADYFMTERRSRDAFANRHPFVRNSWLIFRSILGLVLILLGIVMLVLPGQGILSMLAGLLLLHFPGKRRLELWLLRLPGVLRAINGLRSRAKRPPIELPERHP